MQRLIGLRAICSKCHLVKHIGYASRIGRAGEAIAHLAAVNRWTPRQAKAHVDHAFDLWRRRSDTAYTLDVALLRLYIPASRVHMEWLDKPRVWVSSRLEAIIWASSLLDSDAVIVDTETTGLLSKSTVEVIELAAINMKGKPIFQGLFRPRYKIPKRVIDIHGITNEQVSCSLSFGNHAQDVAAALHGKTIVAFNARFDQEVLARTFKLYKMDPVSARWECAMHAYRAFSNSGPYLPLPGKSHRALADCRATLRLIRRMARAT